MSAPEGNKIEDGYRGRLAPSPTGHLHLGHARTFWMASERARLHHGALILRIEDLDPDRCKPSFTSDLIEDLRWLGLRWQEGPDCGGAYGPYVQSQRREVYRETFLTLYHQGLVYPCQCSRRDVQHSSQAPHADDEPVYPGTCRENRALRDAAESGLPQLVPRSRGGGASRAEARINWRFRVPKGETIRFNDGALGPQAAMAGRDFGDFVIWRHDDVPAYQLAVVTDDAAMRITEVVRGADLLTSTARQLLLFRALGRTPPSYFHCPLLTDAQGVRLAKRHDALSLRALRHAGRTPESLRSAWA